MGEKMVRKRRLINWGAALASLFFFINPDFAIVDVLPDFIGYILLCAAIARAADIDDRISESFALMRKMIFLAVVKFASVVFVMAVIPGSDRPVTLLTLTFVYSALELFFLLPAITKLFDGILYLAARNDGAAAYTPVRRRRRATGNIIRQPKTVTEKLRNFSIGFVIVRAIMRTLPEFAVLSAQGYNDSVWGRMYQYVFQLRVLASATVIIVGIFWLVRAVKYINLLKRDGAWIERLEQKYNAVLIASPDLVARRAIKTAFGFFIAAALLSLDISFDGINYFSDAFSALALLGGLAMIRKYIKNWVLILWSTVLYAVVAAAGTYYRIWFNLNFYPEAIVRDETTFTAHLLTTGITVAESLMFILVVILLLFVALKSIIEKYTGFAMTTNDSYDPSEKIRLLHKNLVGKLWYPAVFALICAALAVASQILIADIRFIWLIEFLFTAIFAVSLSISLRNINEQIDYKYMLS